MVGTIILWLFGVDQSVLDGDNRAEWDRPSCFGAVIEILDIAPEELVIVDIDEPQLGRSPFDVLNEDVSCLVANHL